MRWAAGAIAVVAATALAGCGDRLSADTDFPLVPGAEIVSELEIPSGVTIVSGRYLIVVGPPGTDARELADQERKAVEAEEGWDLGRAGKVVNARSPAPDSVRFGPLPAIRDQIPRRVLNEAESIPDAERRVIVVGMVPPEPIPD